MQDAMTRDVARASPGATATRIGRAIVRRLDVLPRNAALGPVEYHLPLVVYVVVVALVAAAVTIVTFRVPSDWATLAVGGVVTFAEALYAIRAIPGVHAVWTPAVFVQLGLAVTLGPIGAATGAVGESLGFGIRTRNGWFRSVFNAANITLSNITAWLAFHGIAGMSAHGPGLQMVAGLSAGLAMFTVNHGLTAVVLRITNPGVAMLPHLRGQLGLSVYSVGYGLGAFAFLVMHERAGVIGFAALLMPVLLLHLFLIRFAISVDAHDRQQAAFQKEREDLLQKAVEASETERRRIARDLHDGVVQNLAGSAFAMAAKASEIKGKGSADGDPEVLELLQHSAAETRAAMQDLRTLIIELAPPTLRREGLHAALVEILSTLKRKGTHATLDLASNLRLREDRAALIFRVAQEILRNVAAHAQARNVSVELRRDGDSAVLRIADDGKGFTPKEVERRRARGHLGTTAIAELAEEAGGSLEIDTTPGRGTRVTLRVPAG